METFLLLNILSLTPIMATVILTTLSWYEREDAAGSLKLWVFSVALSSILTLFIIALYENVLNSVVRSVYRIVTIWELVMFAYVLSLFMFWYVKKIDRIFILLSITSYSAFLMLLTPLIFFVLGVQDLSTIAILSFGFGGFIGSSISIGINKEIRKGDLLVSLGTFIQIFALGDTFTRYLYEFSIITPNIIYTILIWLVSFLIFGVYYSRRYLVE